MNAKALTLAGLCALALALALPAGGTAATPTVTHNKGDFSGTFSICGLDLGYTFSYSGVEIVKTSGVTLDAGEFTSVWTNPATGKAIMIHAGQLGTTGAPIDNGDGTISFIQGGSGTYIVKAANGSLLSLSAGTFGVRVTINATTGDLVSVEPLWLDGPDSGTPADSSCDTIVAALT
jgi:hypothetical protein